MADPGYACFTGEGPTMSERTVSELIARPVSESVMPLLAETLAAEGLPTRDINDDGSRFFEFCDRGGTRVGFAGLQQFDTFALLRSVVVFPRARTQANGTSIVNWLAAEAVRRGANELFILTTTAADFFEKRGFRPVDRNEAPPAIASTAEFTSLCPASAVLMRRACVT
jgi:N-acetylglutamate synthase-like GNAT family acetyltransferase